MFNRTWEEIRSQLTKLRQVLGQNVNKVKNVKSGQSTDDLLKPTWRYCSSSPCMNAKRSRDTLALSSDNEDTSVTVPSASKPKRQTKTKANNHLLVKEELMKECITALKVNEPPPPKIAEELFGNFVAEKLKALDRRQKMIAEKRITDILFDLEMESMATSFNYKSQSTYPTVGASDEYQPSLGTAGGQSALTTLYPWHTT